MTNFTWYSRLAVWLGAGVILVQALTGRSIGVITLAAVLTLSVGFLSFLSSLVTVGRRVEAEQPVVARHEESEEALVTAIPISLPIESPKSEATVRTAVIESPGDVPNQSERERSRRTITARPPAGRVETIEVMEGSDAEGSACIACGASLRSGQLGATCPLCGGVHHAACWIDHRFHCAREGCAGAGSLEAPREPSVAQSTQGET